MNSRKLSIMILSICMICNYAYSERLYYYGLNEEFSLTKVSDKIALYSKGSTTKEDVINFLSQHQLIASWKHQKLCVVENMTAQMFQSSFSNISLNVSYLPIYLIQDEIEAILFPEIVVKAIDDNYDMTEIIRQYNMTLKKDGGIYQLYSLPIESDPIATANMIFKTGKFRFAYPHFYVPLETFSHFPNDSYFQYQITCHNTGQVFNDGHSGNYDADIDAPEAWEITKGSPDVVVAVFDEGVTSNHPDLPNSRQIRLNGSNFGYGDPNDPSPQGNDNHGNACAGVIAATMDNNEGIAGIAPDCKIMPIRWDSYTDGTGMADGIKFAADNSAKIISCSWGAGSPWAYDPVIVSAIEYAIASGTVVIFAAGNTANHAMNNSGFVTFPANSEIESLITVGASDRYDGQAIYSPSSSLIDVVAPSHRAYSEQIEGETLEMWSLDIPENNGYNPAPYELTDDVINYGELLPNFGINYKAYTGRFGGTSHACPVVAGVVALMLSVNPNLSPNEVYAILTNTSDKVGGYAYIDGKSNELGFGRVNAYAAVLAAKTKYIQNHTYQSGSAVVETYPEIIAGYAVTDNKPYGNVILAAGSDVTFKATEKVVLNPGFRAELGSKFHVVVEAPTTNIASAPQCVAQKISSENTDSTNGNITNNGMEIAESRQVISTYVYSINGQLLQTIAGESKDVSHLPGGIYILHYHMSDGSVKSEKKVNSKSF